MSGLQYCFSIDNSFAYAYYKLDITAVQSGTVVTVTALSYAQVNSQ